MIGVLPIGRGLMPVVTGYTSTALLWLRSQVVSAHSVPTLLLMLPLGLMGTLIGTLIGNPIGKPIGTPVCTRVRVDQGSVAVGRCVRRGLFTGAWNEEEGGNRSLLNPHMHQPMVVVRKDMYPI